MWASFPTETETLQRGTEGRCSGEECVKMIQWPHLGEERSHLQCDPWSHLLLSVSERASSWGNLSRNSHENKAI